MIGIMQEASIVNRMRNAKICILLTLVFGTALFAQPSDENKGVLPSLKDLGIVEAEPEIVLNGIEFDGNTVFSDAELLDLVKDRLGKKVSLSLIHI